MGYRYFAMGSLGIRLSRNKKICLEAIRIATRFEIYPLHLFGVTLPLNTEFGFNGIHSFDSASPTKLAFYGTVLYGSPLKRYVIESSSKQKFRDHNFTFRTNLGEPLPCMCPVCKVDSNALIPKTGQEGKNNRIIHNYFQIKWETEKIA
jgi:queuine/archaeosine tRNA-ribosyltransferase